MSPITCACEKCQAMCAQSVCLPTPDEARELLRRGYADRMGVYVFDDGCGYVAPATVGHQGEVLPRTNVAACTFYKEGRCELHDLGLKPREGRLAHHDRDWREVRLEAMGAWKGKAFESVVAKMGNRG